MELYKQTNKPLDKSFGQIAIQNRIWAVSMSDDCHASYPIIGDTPSTLNSFIFILWDCCRCCCCCCCCFCCCWGGDKKRIKRVSHWSATQNILIVMRRRRGGEICIERGKKENIKKEENERERDNRETKRGKERKRREG